MFENNSYLLRLKHYWWSYDYKRTHQSEVGFFSPFFFLKHWPELLPPCRNRINTCFFIQSVVKLPSFIFALLIRPETINDTKQIYECLWQLFVFSVNCLWGSCYNGSRLAPELWPVFVLYASATVSFECLNHCAEIFFQARPPANDAFC